MSLNSLESEGLRRLCSLSLVWLLWQGKCLCGRSLSPLPSSSMTLVPFWLCFSFRSSGTCLCEEAMGVWGWLWPYFAFWALDISSHLWQIYLRVEMAKPSDCSGSWVAVGRAHCQRGMLCYRNKMSVESSPSPLPSKKDKMWLFSSHLCCKITSSSWFESLVQFDCGQMLANTILCIC